MSLSQAQQQRLASYVADGETAITACTRGRVTYLLTDRRFFTYDEYDGTTTVKSHFLDELGGVNIKKEEGEDFDTDSLAVGVIALFTGLVSLVLQGQMPSGLSLLFLFVGLAGIVGGIIACIYAFDTEDGEISVQLRSPEREVVKSFKLNKDSMDFAKSVSKAASNSHIPEQEHVKTVTA